MSTTLSPNERDALLRQFDFLAREPSFQLLTHHHLKRLAEIESSAVPIVSLYLDLGPQSRQDRKWAIVLKNLIREATSGIGDPRQAREASREIERIEHTLNEMLPDLGRSVAIFASQPIDLWQQVVLPLPLPNRLEVNRRPYLRPLFRALDENERFLVVLLDSERARLFVSQMGFIGEVADLIGDEPIPRRKGLWAHLRFERHKDAHVLWHAGAVAHATALAMDQFGASWLLASGPGDVLADYRNSLTPAVAERFAGEFGGVRTIASPSEVAAAVVPLQQEVEARAELAAVQVLRQEPPGGRAAWGLADTLRSLSEGRVTKLVLLDDYHTPGGECASCGLLAARTEGTCSVCGGALEPREDVTDIALERAFLQSATLELVRSDEARQLLAEMAPIAALLRY